MVLQLLLPGGGHSLHEIQQQGNGFPCLFPEVRLTPLKLWLQARQHGKSQAGIVKHGSQGKWVQKYRLWSSGFQRL